MMNKQKELEAQNILQKFVELLDENELVYETSDDELAVSLAIKDGDFFAELYFIPHVENETVMMISPLDFNVPEERMRDMAVAVSYLNNHIVNGFFDYDIEDGKLSFRTTIPYQRSKISQTVLACSMLINFVSVREYHELLKDLARNQMSLNEFLNAVSQ